MNANEQAQKGFKTFILTLSISLIVFSVVYYLISNNSSFDEMETSQAVQSPEVSANEQSLNVNDTTDVTSDFVEQSARDDEKVVAAENSVPNAPLALNLKEEMVRVQGDVAGTMDTSNSLDTRSVSSDELAPETESVFGSLASGGSVLAGATESTQSSVPSTGVMGVTFGLISSLLVFLGVMIFVAKDPRRMAMNGFEKRVVKDLE